jgi:predicted RecA/RadA family phage recombinase
MKNFIARGEALEITAGADIASGAGVVVNGLFGVAAGAIANGARGIINLTGVYALPKIGSQAWQIGQRVFWNGTAATNAGNAGIYIGTVAAAVGSGAGETVGNVRLAGMAQPRVAFVANASAGSAAEINALRDALVTAGLMAAS